MAASSRKRQLSQDLVICDQCGQPVDKCVLHDDNSDYLEEAIALSDSRLTKFFEGQQCEESLELNITNYCLYDENGHLISIDSGLIESDKAVYMKGYLKPLTDLEDDLCQSVPARDIGPIEQWWISGFDGGERVLIGVQSSICCYNLLTPHLKYKAICESLEFKIMLTKYIIEWIESSPQSTCSQLLHNLTVKCPNLELSRLYQSLTFIVDQILSYDEAGTSSDLKILETPCIRQLIETASQGSLKLRSAISKTKSTGKSIQHAGPSRNIIRRGARKGMNRDSYATCTELVATFFEKQFKGALNTTQDASKSKSIYKQLGSRGYGKAKINLMATKIIWTSKAKHKDPFSKRIYYESTRINGIELYLGDFVTLARNKRSEHEDNTGIGRIIGLFETHDGQKFAHIDFLW